MFVRPHGIYLCHWWHEVGALLNILETFRIDLFVEIGFLDGGLSALMLSRQDYVPGFRYMGIDGLDWNRLHNVLKDKGGADLFQADAFHPETVATIGRAVRASKRAMIYCDNGDKAREANLYYEHLRSGDLLGMHDFSDSEADRHCEVWPKSIPELLGKALRHKHEDLMGTRILLLEKP